ncbi:MAG: adenylate/guanylate cyclase domain-containing protein [Calditrichaeota bacterium]|nr:MAG: adenylate/guanylate cyclase domain-containing protein [Calditrichota bacterium]
MPLPIFEYKWTWDLKTPPEKLWHLVSDTNRFDRDSGLPPIKYLEKDENEFQNYRMPLEIIVFGIKLKYIQEPFEWTFPKRFSVVRNYSSGPVKQLKVIADLIPKGTGTFLEYKVWATPKDILGVAAIPFQIGVLSKINFDKIFRRYDKIAFENEEIFEQKAKVEFVKGGRKRLKSLEEVLAKRLKNPKIVEVLTNVLTNSDEIFASKIQPYFIAAKWELNKKEVLEACLEATRIGLLDFQWNLLCPSCKGAKQSKLSLYEIDKEVHCDACNIDFEANFENSVEITFKPNQLIRKVKENEYCVGGPHLTPHFIAQNLLQPNEEIEISPILEKGRYRIRTLTTKGFKLINSDPVAELESTFELTEEGWSSGENLISTYPKMKFKNSTKTEQLFILERAAWKDYSTTAMEVFLLQKFKDLFSDEVLKPEMHVSVGNLTILFTDLVQSTRMYYEIGDAPAFGKVLTHFEILKKAIDANNGAIVKTIGDAVMATFARPIQAVDALIMADEKLEESGLKLKAGIHSGHCLAVTLNEKIDYFGSTVNIAARLVNFSEGDDVVVSKEVSEDIEVSNWLKKTHHQTKDLSTEIKGFDNQFELLKIEL